MTWFVEGNRRFRDTVFRPQRNLFQILARCQHPTALWIGCSDSRVPPNLIVDAPAGRLFVHRNVGNIVAPGDANLAAVLEYAVEHLRVGEIILCGHSECGAMQALAAGAAEGAARGPIPAWLYHARTAAERVKSECGDRLAEHLDRLVAENVRVQLQHLSTYPCVAEAVADCKLELHGVVYHLATGELELVV